MKKDKIAYIRLDKRDFYNKLDCIYINIRKICKKISIEEVNDGIIINVPYSFKIVKFNKNIIKQIINTLNKNNIRYIIFEKELIILEHELNDYISKNNINKFTGKYFMKIEIDNILDFICKKRKNNIELQNVYMFVNSYNRLNIEIIKNMAKKCKTINIITEQIKYFKKLENNLYQQGLLITVSNNRKKSARNAEYIINFDFTKEKFEQYNINMKSVIINLTDETTFFERLFNGILINNINIKIEKNYYDYIKEFYGNIEMKFFFEKDMLINQYGISSTNKNEQTWEIANLIGIRGVIQKFL